VTTEKRKKRRKVSKNGIITRVSAVARSGARAANLRAGTSHRIQMVTPMRKKRRMNSHSSTC